MELAFASVLTTYVELEFELDAWHSDLIRISDLCNKLILN